MLKKPQAKRKVKRIFNRLIFLLIIFCVTLGSLVSVYLLLSFKKKPLLTPISPAVKLNQVLKAPNDISGVKDILEKSGIDVIDVENASDSATLVNLKGGEQIIFSQNKNLSMQIASLQLIIRQLTIEGRKYSRIDFRFDNPVVVF